jgi:hypothetical protein
MSRSGPGHPSASSATSDTVTLRIAAPPERCYELVSDITRMGRLSPECTGGRWVGSVQGAVVGARFLGFNRRGPVRWFTVNRVVAADPGRRFAFETRGSATRWTYRFTPDGDGTLVTESRAPTRPRPLGARLFAGLLLGGITAHDEELRHGMRATLERLRTVAEQPEPA